MNWRLLKHSNFKVPPLDFLRGEFFLDFIEIQFLQSNKFLVLIFVILKNLKIEKNHSEYIMVFFIM